jgi:DNA replication initiation complex subunit (GINS family)
MQNFEAMALVLGCIGMLCWIACFWWMHRISSRQDAMLEELHEMTTRIEKLSQAEHDLISDVHPQVSEIKEQVENVREVVSSERS